jgi:ATP/maltotriose-dependent transcriptional regulator MalT/transcriptional regulator with XRE-family HTH domain
VAGSPLPVEPPEFVSVGAMLKFLRRRVRLTQRALGLAVGYTEGHISRLEQDQRPPDVATLAALFVPALGLDTEPELAARLLELAAARSVRGTGQRVDPMSGADPIPALPPRAVVRVGVLRDLRRRLDSERRVAVCGLAGMGKTTVVAMLAHELSAGTPVCWITLTSGVTASAEALVRHLAGFLRDCGHPEARRLLAYRQGDGPLTLDEQLGLLGSALRRRPVLICLDNAHLLRSDEVAMAIVAHLLATTPAEMLLTSREDIGLFGVGVLRLAGLVPDEARTLVAATCPEFPPELVERLITRTGGSPMLLRLALGQLPGGAPAGAPGSALLVERLENEPRVTSYLVETTLSGLSSAAWRVLSLLAVFRQPVDLQDEYLVELSQAADGPYDLTAALDEVRHRQLIDNPAAATLHPLVRDQVYARMVGDLHRRRRLHRVVAEWSEHRRGAILEAVYHFSQAGEADRAADLLTAYAGELVSQGLALPAADLAETLLRRRRPDGEEDPPTEALLAVRGELLANTVRTAEAVVAYQEATVAAAPARRPYLMWRLAQVKLQQGSTAEAVDLCVEAAACGPADTLLAAQLATTTAHAHAALSSYDEAIAEANRALDLVGHTTRDPAKVVAEVRARAHLTIGQVLRIQRRFDEAVEQVRQALAAAERSGRADLVDRVRYLEAVVSFEQGDLAAAAAVFTDVLARFQQLGDSYGAARVLLALTQVHLNRAELTEALETIDRSLAIRGQLHHAQGIASAIAVRAEVLLALGRVDEARELIQKVVDPTGPSTTGPWERSYFLAIQAMACLVVGDTAAALSAVETGLGQPGVEGTAVRHLLQALQAIALLIDDGRGVATRPADLADTGHLPPGIRLDLYVLEVMRAMAAGDTVAATEWTATISRYAEETGHTRYHAVAAALSKAVAVGAPLAEVPRLVWASPPR